MILSMSSLHVRSVVLLKPKSPLVQSTSTGEVETGFVLRLADVEEIIE